MDSKVLVIRNILLKYGNTEDFVEKYGELSKDEAIYLIGMLDPELKLKILQSDLDKLPALVREAMGVWIRFMRGENEPVKDEGKGEGEGSDSDETEGDPDPNESEGDPNPDTDNLTTSELQSPLNE